MRYFLTISLTIVCILAKSQIRKGVSFPSDSNEIKLKTELGIPFGTVCKLEVETYAGDKLLWKAYSGVYLLKVNSINGKRINDTLILRYTDETETLSDAQIAKTEKKYPTKKITIMAYETGQFSGIPEKYFDYNYVPPGVPKFKGGTPFLFEHSLVVISNLTAGR